MAFGSVTYPAILWTAATLVLSPFIGSFLGVVITRLPRFETIIHGRSHCTACGVTLSPRDLIPLASFLWLRGRCRICAAPIPRLLPVIEIAALVIAAASIVAAPSGPTVMADAALGWALLALAAIDIATFRLPDAITLPLLLAGLALAAAHSFDAATTHAATATLCYLGLRGLGAAFRALRGVDGLGAGDAKLLAAGGAWLGPQAIPSVLLLAGLIGLAWFAALALTGKPIRRTTAIPFGPALAAALWLARLAGL